MKARREQSTSQSKHLTTYSKHLTQAAHDQAIEQLPGTHLTLVFKLGSL